MFFQDVAFIILIVICMLLIITNYLNQKKLRELSVGIDDFLKNGRLTQFSTSDNEIAHLQNNICELENRIVQERDYLKKESKSNAQFISDISHQLKTPLAGLRLYCEMEDKVFPEGYMQKNLELIEKMENLIFNVLKLEKIRSDTYIMNFEENEISDVMEDIKRDFLPLFTDKKIEIYGSAYFRFDKEWFYEAFANVVKNACEHTRPDGQVWVFIEEGESAVSITIEDNGGGVSSEEVLNLFERFHRADNAAPNSAGIGLAITKAIIEKHHGTISAGNGKMGLRIVACLPVIDANLKL